MLAGSDHGSPAKGSAVVNIVVLMHGCNDRVYDTWHGPFNHPAYTQCGHDEFSFCSIGCDTPAARPSVIPDIMDEYVRVKREFVDVCTTRGSPTLEEVKDLCIDLIDCAFRDVPRITCQEEDIERAKTFKELARVLCFRLSKWVSYDFLRKIIAHFQPALASVKERLMHYEDQLKPFLLQKLENIAELQRR